MRQRPMNSWSPPPGRGGAATKPTLIDTIRRAIVRLLGSGHHPGVREAALATGMSVRTFQRQLAEMGLTYSELVDEVRFAEARRRLAEPGKRIKRVAAEVGFSEPASFTRAFRRWAGLSPREYRQTLGRRRSPASSGP